MIGNLWTRWTKRPVEPTQRERVIAALTTLNDILGTLPEKPSVRLDLAQGTLAIDLPEQMPDEALALPAPAEPSDDGRARPDPEKVAA